MKHKHHTLRFTNRFSSWSSGRTVRDWYTFSSVKRQHELHMHCYTFWNKIFYFLFIFLFYLLIFFSGKLPSLYMKKKRLILFAILLLIKSTPSHSHSFSVTPGFSLWAGFTGYCFPIYVYLSFLFCFILSNYLLSCQNITKQYSTFFF